MLPQTPKQRTEYSIRGAGYAMWRLNWIHPFNEGNGRTSWALAYLVLCAYLHTQLHGRVTILERIVQTRLAYFDALDAADAACREGRPNIACAAYLGELLFEQLDGKP